MKLALLAFAALSALPASAAQTFDPALLPTLIGSPRLVLEQSFGKPARECTGSRRIGGEPFLRCSYKAGGKSLSVVYEAGVATEVVWVPQTTQGRLTQFDLGFGEGCKGPSRQAGSGGEVWSQCPGGLSVEIQNLDSGGTFLVHVSVRDLLIP